MDREDHDQDDRPVETGVAGDQAGDQDPEGHEPGPAEGGRGDRAHRRLAVSGQQLLPGFALGDDFAYPDHGPKTGGDQVARDRQPGHDEDRKRDREHDQVEAANESQASSTHAFPG